MRDAYIFLVLIFQNRNHIIDSNKTNSRAFCFSSICTLVLSVFAAIFTRYLHIRNTEFCLTEPYTFYLCFFSFRSSEPFYLAMPNRHQCFVWVNVRIWTSTVAAKSPNLIKRIFGIFLPLLFHSIFERKHFDFYVPLSADFDADECAINFRMCDIRIEQKIKWPRSKAQLPRARCEPQNVACMRNCCVELFSVF